MALTRLQKMSTTRFEIIFTVILERGRTLLELSLPVLSSASRKYLHPLSLGSIIRLLQISYHGQHCETATLHVFSILTITYIILNKGT